MLLILGLMGNVHAALHAITAKTIQGHEPRLSAELETQISQPDIGFSLFSFTFNGVDYDDKNIDTLNIEPMLNTPAGLKAAISTKLKAVLSESEATDADGDDGFTLSEINPLIVKIRDSENRDISSRTDDFCNVYNTNTAPFKIEISGDIRLSTRYGDPSYKDYTASTLETNKVQPLKQYTILVSGTCHAKPNPLTDYGTHPSWVSTKGFKFQSDTNANQNFPTTGFHGAKFYLNIVGVDASELIFEPLVFVNGNVTTAVSSIDANTLLVELSGPSASQANGLGPVKFEPPGPIVIQDKDNRFKYMFNVQQWFIPRKGTIKYDSTEGGEYYCNHLASEGDYRVPSRSEYTNTPYANAVDYPPYPETNGTNPLASKYSRAIGGGVFSEWGYMIKNGFYPSSDWQSSKGYWTSEAWSSTKQYTVSTGSGYLASYLFSDKSYVRIACVNQ